MLSHGTLEEAATGRLCALEPDHTVGRTPAPGSSLFLDKPHVSGVHAGLRWTRDGWVVRDLGSRNGTFVDGVRIRSGEDRRLRRGSRIGFGSADEVWTLVDDSPPIPMAVPLAGGEPVLMVSDLLALPCAENAHATIYRAGDGPYTLELAAEGSRPLANRDTFDVDGTLWRFCCPGSMADTVIRSDRAPVRRSTIASLRLEFRVSRNEEFVHLLVTDGTTQHDLRSRGHNYLLLTLARRRIADAEDGFADTSCGWVDQEELAHDPTMVAQRLNTNVFRIREQFDDLAVADAANIIERRSRPAQLRIGTGHLSIVTI